MPLNRKGFHIIMPLNRKIFMRIMPLNRKQATEYQQMFALVVRVKRDAHKTVRWRRSAQRHFSMRTCPATAQRQALSSAPPSATRRRSRLRARGPDAPSGAPRRLSRHVGLSGRPDDAEASGTPRPAPPACAPPRAQAPRTRA